MKLRELLRATDYDAAEIDFLYQGFMDGFDLNYQGPTHRRDTSKNIPFTAGVGDKLDMWSKIMKEVKECQVAGPFEEIPFDYYIQSPIRLVPKAGNKTRLIFHLSYNFGKEESEKFINYFIPDELCTVKYNDLDEAISASLWAHEYMTKSLQWDKVHRPIYYGKSDALSAFRMVPLSRKCWFLLIFMAADPQNGQMKYFVDKCLPFKSRISCSHYQLFSDAVVHILRTREVMVFGIINYLDDYLFIEITRARCNALIKCLLKLCEEISLPISMDKTEWASTIMIFSGESARWTKDGCVSAT